MELGISCVLIGAVIFTARVVGPRWTHPSSPPHSPRSSRSPRSPPLPPLAFQKNLGCGQLPRLPFGDSECAVVGSSDLLSMFPMGDEIDRHKVVVRINHAPTIGFEHIVGSRTTVRILNHVTADNWNGKLKPKAGEFKGTGSEYPRDLCGTNASATCITIEPPIHYTMLATQSHPCGRGASTGRIAVAMALKVCNMVNVYGFFPDCCRPQDSWLRGLNYKYYHSNQSNWVCCDGGRENMHTELSAYTIHSRVRVHHSSLKQYTGLPNRCAIVGAAHAPHQLWSRAIDSADTVFRVNHAPPGTQYNKYSDLVGTRTDIRTVGDGTLRMMLDGRINSSSLCKTPIRCVFLSKYAHQSRYQGASRKLLKQVRNKLGLKLSVASSTFTRRSLLFKAQTSTRRFTKITLSGGLATTLYAYERCSRVDVFLMETMANESCCARKSRYAYYKTGDCCERSRETRDEYRSWIELQRLGVAVHSTSNLSSNTTEHAVAPNQQDGD